MNEQIIIKYFVDAGTTPEGAAALWGNICKESLGYPMNLEDRANRNFGMSDEEYTAAVDNGTYSNFAYDKGGYGLFQWTYPSRKRNLLKMAQSLGKSIGDLKTQLEFAKVELQQEFRFLWVELCKSTDIDSLCDRVCREYENPAVKNYIPRRAAAREGLSNYNGGENIPNIPIAPSKEILWPPREVDKNMSGKDIVVLSALLSVRDYSVDVSPNFTQKTEDCVKEFQRKNSLTADGIVGKKTWAALKGYTAK